MQLFFLFLISVGLRLAPHGNDMVQNSCKMQQCGTVMWDEGDVVVFVDETERTCCWS